MWTHRTKNLEEMLRVKYSIDSKNNEFLKKKVKIIPVTIWNIIIIPKNLPPFQKKLIFLGLDK